MLRIEKESDGHTTTTETQWSNSIDQYRRHTGSNGRWASSPIHGPGRTHLADVEVVRFLRECEDGGVVLVHCPPYVREWILRERTEGAQP